MLFGKSEPKLIMFKTVLSRCKQINILVFSHHNLGVHSLQSRVRKKANKTFKCIFLVSVSFAGQVGLGPTYFKSSGCVNIIF